MQNNLNYKNDNKCNSKPQKKNTVVGCHFLLQGYLPDPGIEPMSLTYLALVGDSLPLCHLENIHVYI